jgi:LPS export ABC transporter protein LptC
LGLLLSISACQSAKPTADKPVNSNIVRSDTQLTLNDAILEQSSNQGQSLWRIKAEKTFYSQDRHSAKMEKITANFLQAGKLVLQISGEQGESQNDGKTMFLRGNIIATDPRNGSTIRSEEVEWRTEENVLFLRQNLTGSYPNLEISAAEGKYYLEKESLELEGNIIVTTKISQPPGSTSSTKPSLQLKTQQLVWLIPEKRVKSDRGLEIIRSQENTITDKLVADRGEVRLAEYSTRLENNIELQSLDPSIQIATNSLEWNYQTRFIHTNKPIKIVDRNSQLIITGNQGQIDLTRKIANLWGGVDGVSLLNKAKLYAEKLTWNIPTKVVEANENIIYYQSDPAINVTGDKAVGKLTDNNVVVSSIKEKGKQVTSVIDNP